VRCRVTHGNGTVSGNNIEASWHHNAGPNSYWTAKLGPFLGDDKVDYCLLGYSDSGEIFGPASSFQVGGKIHLAILWHQHQPFYLERDGEGERYRFPWVRLHAVRDYYAMAAILAEHPEVHATINLAPSLLRQIEGYLERQATDRALELSRKPAVRLTAGEREEMLGSFFDADWHNQIYPHPRYKELFEQSLAGKPFSPQDITDLQLWFNLAWFAPEFLERSVRLHDGANIDLRPLLEKQRGFSESDIEDVLQSQYAVMRNIIPLHRALQDAGQIEVSTTPFYHPILPLLHDTDTAAISRPGAPLPGRFQAPQDAQSQVMKSVRFYEERFGRKPRGMWPAEGAVGQTVLDYFVRAGIRWIASDQGVLERSGRWGYRIDEPDVLCRPYRAEGRDGSVSVFFRDQPLSDAIGFKYQSFPDQAEAARAFIADIKGRLAARATDHANRVVSVILDGENAWGSYRQAARPFLHALYRALSEDREIKTVTFSEYLDGNAGRAVHPHPLEAQPKVYELFHASWTGTGGPIPGVDFGTWIGEREANRAWELLRRTREDLAAAGAEPESHPEAFEALYAAEGSDWFWWYGDDHESGYDDVFDELYRGHLRAAYLAAHLQPPESLAVPIVRRTVAWSFARPVHAILPSDSLTIRTKCAGLVHWSADGGKTRQQSPLIKAGGVMAGLHSYSLTLGPFGGDTTAVEFTFFCEECRCHGQESCCGAKPQKIAITGRV